MEDGLYFVLPLEPTKLDEILNLLCRFIDAYDDKDEVYYEFYFEELRKLLKLLLLGDE